MTYNIESEHHIDLDSCLESIREIYIQLSYNIGHFIVMTDESDLITSRDDNTPV